MIPKCRKEVSNISDDIKTQESTNASDVYIHDKQSFKDFENGKKSFNYESFKRLVLSELSYHNCFDENRMRCLGFTKRDIINMTEKPERYGKNILRLSNLMYLKSGYYKRLIDYFANQAMVNYTIDTKIQNIKMFSLKPDRIKKDYMSFAVQCDRFNLSNEIHNILRRVYKNDVCYAFMIDNDIDVAYYYLDPMICDISSLVNGNVYEFYIKRNALTASKIKTLPQELQEIIDRSDKKCNKIYIPYDKSLCIKYNNDFLFPYPPFFMMIADILLIDEYKELAKAQSINDAYKILTMKIPTKDGEISLDGGLISTFTKIVLDTVQNNIGVITTPFDVESEEFSSSNADDRDMVPDAISWAFKNVGVSESLMSGASSGSELKLSIVNDSGDIFRLYRMLENWINLQMKLRGYIYSNYEFVYKIMDMTIFNAEDVQSNELKMSQSGLPNKMRLGAANGFSPIAIMGNTFIENTVFGEMFDSWNPLKTSYTMSNDNSGGGRPQSSDSEISEVTETQRDNGSNNTENRI